MKTTTNIMIALIVAGTTLGVYAEETATERDGSRKEAQRAKMLERFDKDGDGKLGPKERKHAKNMREKSTEKGSADGTVGKRGKRGENGEVGERSPRGEAGERGPKGRQHGQGGGRGNGNGGGARK